MNKLSHKSHTLRSLLLIPTVVDIILPQAGNFSQIDTKTSELHFQNDVNLIREKVVQVIDSNIIRLQKIRNRIVKSSKDGKASLISRIDSLIQFFRKEKPLALKINSYNQLKKITEIIDKKTKQNDINLDSIFYNKKDLKQEKFFHKLIKKLDNVKKEVERFSTDRKQQAQKILHKAYSIIDQLQHESKKDKSKAETRNLRRELANCLNQIKLLTA